jgi:hypothetical protein
MALVQLSLRLLRDQPHDFGPTDRAPLVAGGRFISVFSSCQPRFEERSDEKPVQASMCVLVSEPMLKVAPVSRTRDASQCSKLRLKIRRRSPTWRPPLSCRPAAST